MKYFFKEQSTKNVMAAKLMILSFQEETHRFNSDLTQDLSECLKRSKQEKSRKVLLCPLTVLPLHVGSWGA